MSDKTITGTNAPWLAAADADADAHERTADGSRCDVMDQVVVYYDAYAHRLFCHLAIRFASDDDAADAVHETFIRLQRTLARHKPIESPRAWLFQVGENILKDVRKSRAREARRAPLVALDLVDRLRQAEVAPDVRLLRQEQVDAFLAAVQRLPPMQRRFVMARAHGLTLQEMADADWNTGERNPKRISDIIGVAVEQLETLLK